MIQPRIELKRSNNSFRMPLIASSKPSIRALPSLSSSFSHQLEPLPELPPLEPPPEEPPPEGLSPPPEPPGSGVGVGVGVGAGSPYVM